jgi:hypothetical protein
MNQSPYPQFDKGQTVITRYGAFGTVAQQDGCRVTLIEDSPNVWHHPSNLRLIAPTTTTHHANKISQQLAQS